MIRLRTLGECVIDVAGTAFTPDFDAVFAALLYLATERGAPTPRGVLAGLLWPHHDGEDARHCLRQVLYRMRNADVPVEGARDTVWIPHDRIAPTFSAAPSAERFVAERDAGTLRLGGFLPGYWPKLSDPLARWVDATRAATESRVRRALLELIRAHRLRGEWEQIESLAVHCLQLDPLNQEATFAHTEATAMLGGKGDALVILDRYIGELTGSREDVLAPAVILRRRIAERFPARSYASRADQCFVGRADTLELLATALDRARAGRGGGVVLTGAPGIGKTRVTQEFVRAATLQGARLVRVTIQESDCHRPMAAFADAVPQLRTLSGAIGVSPDSLTYLQRLTEPPATIPPTDDGIDPHWIAMRIRQSVVDLVDAVTGENTVVLLIDDVHWLDAQSWAALAAISDTLAQRRLLIILTSRGPYPATAIPDRCVTQFSWHPLPPLDPTAADELVRAVAATTLGKLAPGDVTWCIDAGEGNPLFLRELTTHRTAGGAADVVPPSLTALLDGRVDSLSDHSRRLLDAVAVADGVATLDELTEILEFTAHEMANALDGLSEAGLLSEDSPTAELRHELLKLRIARHMPPTVQRLFHRRIAATLTAGPAAVRSADRVLAAAKHWQAAGDVPRALDSLLQSASAVEPLGAPGECVRLLQAAVELPTSARVRRNVLRRFATALSWEGAWSRIEEILERVLRERSFEETADQKARDELQFIDAAFRSGREVGSLLEKCIRITGSTNLTPSTRLLAARKSVFIASNTGLCVEHLPFWDFVDHLSKAQQNESVEPHMLAMMRATLGGDGAKMFEAAERVTSLADGLQPGAKVGALFHVGEAHRALGYVSDAKRIYEYTQEEALRLGMTYQRARAVERLATIELNTGHAVEGRDWNELYASIVQHSHEAWDRQALLYSNVKLALLERRYADAVNVYDAYVQALHASNSTTAWQRREHITLAAELQLVVRDDPVELRILEDLLEIHECMSRSLLHDRTVEVLIAALLRAGQSSRADSILHEYLVHRISDKAWDQREERLPVSRVLR